MAKTKGKPKLTKAADPRPRNDVYTALLFVTFAAIVAGCVLLYLDFEGYNGQTGPSEDSLKVKAVVPKLGDPNAYIQAPPKAAAPTTETPAPTEPPVPAPADGGAPPAPAPAP